MARIPARDDLAQRLSVFAGCGGLLTTAAIFSVFVNLLMLTGPLFMLQIYDRVLPSGSVETLVGLFVLVAFLFAVMGVLDVARAHLLGRVGARMQDRLDPDIFDAAMRRATTAPDDALAQAAPGDVAALRGVFATPAVAAVLDLPWTPVFLAAIAVFHPMLGALALVGGAAIVAIALVNQATSRAHLRRAAAETGRADTAFARLARTAEMVTGLGAGPGARARWQETRRTALDAVLATSDRTGGFGALSRTFRHFLQSAMLALGAYLAIGGAVSAGAIVAASILLGRALQPVETIVAQWQSIAAALAARRRLTALLDRAPPPSDRTDLPRPKARLDVRQLTVLPPGRQQATLRLVGFDVRPGEAVGVIGPSGAGKSTLARALVGIWRPAGGQIRLDGATLDQFPPGALGRHVGYLPQRVELFDGTIAENIARLDRDATDAAIVAAAEAAAAHEMILGLPDGYDTRVTGGAEQFSGGQLQRIGLARALFGDPVLLVLDEPNASLDGDGSAALNDALRRMKARGGAVILMAHRPAALAECDRLLVLDAGMRRAFGPRDEVLRETVENHAALGLVGGATP